MTGLLCERKFEVELLRDVWEKVLTWECLYLPKESGIFLPVYVDDVKVFGKQQNLGPMWKIVQEELEFEVCEKTLQTVITLKQM